MSTFKNFFDRFPAPTAKVAKLTVDDLASLMASSKAVPGRDYVVVDVRRMDLEVCFLALDGDASWGLSGSGRLGRRKSIMFIHQRLTSPHNHSIRHSPLLAVCCHCKPPISRPSMPDPVLRE